MIGKKVREIRIGKGLTQAELAKKSKLTLRTIQRIELDKNTPRDYTLNQISTALGIDIAMLYKTVEKPKSIWAKMFKLSLLVLLNIFLMTVIGYATLDSNANTNSRITAFILSFSLPFLIANQTPKTTSWSRLLKYGSGYTFYLIPIVVQHYNLLWSVGFKTGLIPCLILGLSTLYFVKYNGNRGTYSLN